MSSSDVVHYVSVIEDNLYLTWQQEVQLYNFKELGIADQLWIVILYQGASPNSAVIEPLLKEHRHRIRLYQNTQPRDIVSGYKAMNKPWGISRLLQEEPQLGRFLFSIDSDVWFKRPVKFDTMQDDHIWYGSDCSSYLNSAHWQEQKQFTFDELDRITRIAGVTASTFQKINDRAVGAQLLFKDVDWQFFATVAEDAWRIHDALKEIHDNGKSNQHWVAEMLSFILHMLRVRDVGGIATHDELRFAWATTSDDAEFASYNIVHMAGVFERDGPCFCKERYTSVTPWQCPRGLDYVTAKGASQGYIALLSRYRSYLERELGKHL